MIQLKNNIYTCGNINTFGMKIKILNSEYGRSSDCVYKFFFEGNQYGIYDETTLISHDFIECSMLDNDITYVIKNFQKKEIFFDLTNVVSDITIEESMQQIIRFHYCRYMKDELDMDYSESINKFIKQTTKIQDNTKIVTFIMNGHDSTQNYFLIPYYLANTFYLAVIHVKHNEYEDFKCDDEYNWNFSKSNFIKINRNTFINVLKCAKNVISNLACPVPPSQSITPLKND